MNDGALFNDTLSNSNPFTGPRADLMPVDLLSRLAGNSRIILFH